jgi:type II secretory pathway component GspD/PulD (secretin)
MILGAIAASAQDAAEEAKGLDTLVEEISVQGQSLPEVADLLATLGSINLNVSGSVDPKVSVNLTVKTPKTIREVLNDLATQYNLWIDTSQAGNILIRPGAERPQKAETIIDKTFPVRFNRPSDIIDLIRNFLSDRPQADALPLDSEKAIHVRDIPEAVARIEEFLNRIDIPKQSTVFPILYGNAEDIANIIKERLPDLEENAITVDTANSQLIVKTTLENLAEIQLLIETLDIKKEIRVFTISFHMVEDVVSVLEELTLVTDETAITYNEDTGRLIIQDTPDRLDRIAEAIRAYDTPRPSVFVEAEILDVNANYSFGWNPTLYFDDAAQDETSTGGLVDGQQILRLAGLNSFEFAALDAGSVLARIRANENDSDVQTLASPRLFVERNEEARLNVGSEEPIGVRSFSNNQFVGTSRDIVTQRVREVGIRLIIEALNISDRGYVELSVGLENSSVPPDGRIDIGGGTTGLRVLTANIETVALLKDGRTLAVGGLLSRNTSETSGGIPFLNKVPLIRYFFSNLGKADTRRKLLLFITPHILNIDTPLKKFEEAPQTEVTLGGKKKSDLTPTSPTSSEGVSSQEWSEEGDQQWVNRDGRWGFMDASGKFVDRTDLFLSAYEEKETEAAALNSLPSEDGRSASELLRGLDEPAGPPRSEAREMSPKPAAPEKAPSRVEAPAPEPQPPTSGQGPAAPEAIEALPPKVDTAPSAPEPVPSEPAQAPEVAAPATPPTLTPEPSPAGPQPTKALRRPNVSGEAALQALKTPADELGQFKGSLRELLTRVRTGTGVQYSSRGVDTSVYNTPVEVDGGGKTYDQVLQEVLRKQGLDLRGQKSGPVQIYKPAPAAPAAPPSAPNQPPAAPEPSAQPQSRLDDPWAAPPVAGGWKRLGGEPRSESGQKVKSNHPAGKPVPSLQPESWEEPVTIEQKPVPSVQHRFSPATGSELKTSRASLSQEEWDRILDGGQVRSEVTRPLPPPAGFGRHTSQPPGTIQGAEIVTHPGKPVALVQPATELKAGRPARKGAWSKIKSFLTPHK